MNMKNHLWNRWMKILLDWIGAVVFIIYHWCSSCFIIYLVLKVILTWIRWMVDIEAVVFIIYLVPIVIQIWICWMVDIGGEVFVSSFILFQSRSQPGSVEWLILVEEYLPHHLSCFNCDPNLDQLNRWYCWRSICFIIYLVSIVIPTWIG